MRVRGLKKYFPINAGLLIQRQVGAVKAVDDVSFDIYKGYIYTRAKKCIKRALRFHDHPGCVTKKQQGTGATHKRAASL